MSVVKEGNIHNICPVDFRPLPLLRVSTEEQVRQAVQTARLSQSSWEKVGLKEKVQLLKQAARDMIEHKEEIINLLYEEVGKIPSESMMGEALGPLQSVSDWENIIKSYVKARKVPISLLAFPKKSIKVHILPKGVIGIITPWNFPIGVFFKSLFPALLCGNSVVIKPSEYASRSALWLVQMLNRYLPAGILSAVFGDKETGKMLIASGIDALTFTGSFASGSAVVKFAAEHMIPCSAELGGKDPAIVLADCDMDRTIGGILHSAFFNAGQVCASIERVYVEEAIADRFIQQLTQATQKLRCYSGNLLKSDIGPLINFQQLQNVEALVADALQKGAKLLSGGKRGDKGYWYEPTILDHCNHSMKICLEPTFGPVIPIVRVASADQALALANASDYGLCGSVWSKNIAKALSIASQLKVGTSYVNNHGFTGAVIQAPWTGVKQSGTGIANSIFSLGHYTRPMTLVVDKNLSPDIWWFPISDTLAELGRRLAAAQIGKWTSIFKIPFLIRRRKKEVTLFSKGKGHLRFGKLNDRWQNIYRAYLCFWDRISALTRVKLTKREESLAIAILETIFPTPNHSLPEITNEKAKAELKEILDSSPLAWGIVFRFSLKMIALSTWFKGNFTSFEKMSYHERIVHIQRFQQSPLHINRKCFMLLKLIGGYIYAKTSRLPISKTPYHKE